MSVIVIGIGGSRFCVFLGGGTRDAQTSYLRGRDWHGLLEDVDEAVGNDREQAKSCGCMNGTKQYDILECFSGAAWAVSTSVGRVIQESCGMELSLQRASNACKKKEVTVVLAHSRGRGEVATTNGGQRDV